MLPRAVQDELQRLSATYKIDGREDKGANGWLFFATNKVTGVKLAIKFYWWGDQPALHGEPRFLAQFNSPNIIPILAAELIGGGWACFICPRYASDVEGLILREGASVHRALDIGMNILSGVGALHGSNVVHRDLKPANILLRDDGVAAIGDFGSVATLDSETNDVPASRHSMIYRPPESFVAGRFSPSGDLYQVGVVLYELLGGSLPKDPLSWLTSKERAVHNAIASECDRSLYQDEALQKVISSGRLIKRQSMPFWVSSKIKAEIAKQTATSIDRRACTAGSMMASLLALRRQTINWVGADFGAIGVFDGGSARVVISENDHRVEIDRGKGWRRDRTLESYDPAASCELIDQKFS